MLLPQKLRTRIQRRVSKGAAFLDRVHPGWALKIVVPELSLQSPQSCVLGQLYGSFDEGVEKYDLEKRDRDEALGFEAALQDINAVPRLGPDAPVIEPIYCALDMAWAYEIGLRRRQGPRRRGRRRPV